MTRTRAALAALGAAAVASVALAAVSPPSLNLAIQIEPVERVTLRCDYRQSVASVTLQELRVMTGTDATPADIVVGPASIDAANDHYVTIVIDPCPAPAADTCRDGNKYQLRLIATMDAEADVIACNLRVDVDAVQYRKP
jgi:hypothetical protein